MRYKHTKIFEGRNREEVHAKARNEFGNKYIVLSEKEDIRGGFFGFFGQRVVVMKVAILEEDISSLRPPQRHFSFTVDDDFSEKVSLQKNQLEILRMINKQELKKTKTRNFNVYENLSSNKQISSQSPQSFYQKSSSNDEMKHLKKELQDMKSLVLNLTKKIEQISEIKVVSATSESGKTSAGLKNVLPKNLEEIYNTLVEQEFDQKLISVIMRKLKDFKDINSRKELMKFFIRQLKGQCLCEVKNKMKLPGVPEVIILVGPTGVGKTTTIQKLAVPYVLKDEADKIVMLTLDNYRLGAAEQLQSFADVVDAPCYNPNNKEEFKEYLDKYATADYIFIDTVGRGPFDLDEIKEIKDYLSVIPYEKKIYLTMSASTREKDLERIMKNFSIIDYDELIFTKLDETLSYGPIFNIMYKKRKKVGYFTNGQVVHTDLMKAGDGEFIDWFFKRVFPEDHKELEKDGFFSKEKVSPSQKKEKRMRLDNLDKDKWIELLGSED